MKNAKREFGPILAGRLHSDLLISVLEAKFTALPANNIDSAIEPSLRLVSHSLQIDQIRVLEFSNDGTQPRVAHSWENPPPHEFVATDFPWSLKKLASGKTIRAQSISDLPKCAANDKNAYTRLGVKSIASIPFGAGRSLQGATLFGTVKAERVWSDELIDRLTNVTHIIAGALKRKRIPGTLCSTDEQFRVMADSAPVMIWMSGPDKGCTHFNQKWLEFTGRSWMEEIGSGWTRSVHPEDLQRCMGIYEQAFDARAEFRMEYRLRRCDGQYRWIVDSGAPRFDAHGSFAGFIGSCVDISESKDAEQAIRRLTGQIINAQEEERRRIARELHDDISQSLALLAIDIERIAGKVPSCSLREPLHQLSIRAVEISKHSQYISHQLHSSQLELLGLGIAARNCCDEYTRRQQIEVDYKQNNLPARVPADISLCVFRVLQEALRNAVKHSGADRVHVELGSDGNEIRLSVRDAGKGFDLNSAILKGGLGLVSMRERLHLVDGRISIRSRPNHGTELDVQVPIREDCEAIDELTPAA